MQDRMALCFHGVFLGQPPSYCIPLSFMFPWKHSQPDIWMHILSTSRSVCHGHFRPWTMVGKTMLGWGWPVENSGKLTLSLVIKNRIQMASRGAEGNNDRHQQAFVRKNFRGGWHEALQMYPGTPGEKLINLFLFWKGSKEMDTGQLFLKIDTLCFPMEFWKPMCSVDLACKYDDEWFEKWKTCLHRECIGV